MDWQPIETAPKEEHVNLHGQIMNIQFKQPDDVAWTVAEQKAAKIAHRDARHAAAAIALEADVVLEVALDALRKDAARYRWLRQQQNDTSAPRIDVVYWTVADESANDGDGLRMEELDAAVDEAMRSNDQHEACELASTPSLDAPVGCRNN